MKVYLVYFSPSGTTLRTLENIVKGMGNVEVIRIDMSKPKNRDKQYIFSEDDIVLYGTITAALLFTPNKEIFANITGNGAKFIGVAQFGNGYYGVTLKQLQQRAVKQGFQVVGLGAFIGQHSENSEVAKGRPDEQDAKIQKQFGHDIMQKILNGNYKLEQRPKIGWSISPLYNLIVFSRLFQLSKDYEIPASLKLKEINEDKCVECRICEHGCPTQAVSIKNKSIDTEKCISCFRCINCCPKGAIRSSSKTMNNIVEDFGNRVGKKRRMEPTIIL
ncbi:EFR1 family ferrodoxin [Bacteroides graminisolvens]|jgi:ferredoxin|uniref:Ferredoxin n=1 Tax=Bacteroides graminisolvens DSM 19988 = JCM 15093 TaxID=1121097 RepID=A0A069D283_9BACE|nr:EFR1 family ferrodoxin [Bacteroides graminisolvens]GAK36993.1 ferredoxin [Bacteroides graminisolvens DSM 19988 = JCM 15093]